MGMTDHMTVFEADKLLEEALVKHSVNLGVLIAETGIWAAPEVHHYLLKENGTGAWRLNTRRTKSGEVRRTFSPIDGTLLDDNSYANTYIKAAVGLKPRQVVGYETCHIWASTCYHPEYHTTIANLVLLPRALAGLTDHNKNVSAVLQYRSFDLYGFHPAQTQEPTKPINYPAVWLDPRPFSDRVKRSLQARAWAKTFNRLDVTSTFEA
jgi:hypothetical protein